MSWRAAISACVLGLTISTTAAACGTTEDDMQRDIEQSATEAREAMDALANELGDNVDVRDDVIIDCVPGDRDSGKTLSYSLSVTVGEDALDRLASIATRYRAEGWDTQLRDEGSRLTLRGDVASVVASVFVEEGRANIIGNSDCVQ